ncbi:hypothetical protein Dimus_013094 [Dionaea muscipula]
MHTASCKEFYANLTVFIYKKKEIAKSRVKGVEIEFDSMKLASILDVPGHTEEEDEEEGGNQAEFDWEAVIDEAAVEGESRSDEQFYDAQVDVEEQVTETPAAPEVVAQASVQQKETTASGVDPSCPTCRIPEAVMNKLQAEFERARANRF